MAKQRKRFRFIRRILRIAAIAGMVAAWRKRQADQNDRPPTV